MHIIYERRIFVISFLVGERKKNPLYYLVTGKTTRVARVRYILFVRSLPEDFLDHVTAASALTRNNENMRVAYAHYKRY